MKLVVAVLLLTYFGMFTSPAVGNFIGGCWDAWSRCSRWSYWATGKAWLTCEDDCQQTGKHGKCELSKSNCPIFPKTYQCQCY